MHEAGPCIGIADQGRQRDQCRPYFPVIKTLGCFLLEYQRFRTIPYRWFMDENDTCDDAGFQEPAFKSKPPRVLKEFKKVNDIDACHP